jgi:hypothetical protein
VSKKHFIALASVLLSLHPRPFEDATAEAVHLFDGAMVQWQRTVEAVASFCAGQSGNFDRSRFLDACGFDQ